MEYWQANTACKHSTVAYRKSEVLGTRDLFRNIESSNYREVDLRI